MFPLCREDMEMLLRTWQQTESLTRGLRCVYNVMLWWTTTAVLQCFVLSLPCANSTGCFNISWNGGSKSGEKGGREMPLIIQFHPLFWKYKQHMGRILYNTMQTENVWFVFHISLLKTPELKKPARWKYQWRQINSGNSNLRTHVVYKLDTDKLNYVSLSVFGLHISVFPQQGAAGLQHWYFGLKSLGTPVLKVCFGLILLITALTWSKSIQSIAKHQKCKQSVNIHST